MLPDEKLIPLSDDSTNFFILKQNLFSSQATYAVGSILSLFQKFIY
jgi:hypothetical protein